MFINLLFKLYREGEIMGKIFDLNIEQVLEHWEIEHAIREIIANALDEQMLTNTRDIEIYRKGKNEWHIRDYGRGLRYLHFTQNENKEKLEADNLIGKFGVGLKDALAVFNQHDITVEINSRYASITLSMEEKSGFNLNTLHAVFDEPKDKSMIGTDFSIIGVTANDIKKAKSMFLKFNKLGLLEKTAYGEVYKKDNNEDGSIYINGIKIATESNFMFSYNITNISAQIKKALNRERSNVGRTAYSNTIKKILVNCKEEAVLLSLVNDLENISRGSNKDETSWIDVASYAAQELNKLGNVLFMTAEEHATLTNEEIEILENSGKRVVFITDSLKEKNSHKISDFSDVMVEYKDSFKYKYVKSLVLH